MATELSTPLIRLEQGRAVCIQLVQEANRFLVENGQKPVEVVPAEKLQFALMGQYNAGKSTLVNALLGRREAETGDTPTTSRPQAYDFHNFHILDLPGSDARDTEEDEARNALEKAHLVLYVVSSQTGLALKSFWDDLRWLSERGQPFLAVINDKQGYPDRASEQAFREEVLDYFYRQARVALHRSDWADCLFWVNAQRAEKGRLEGKPRFEESSGIIPLEDTIVSLLSGSDVFLRSVPRLGDLRLALRTLQKAWGAQLTSYESQVIHKSQERCEVAREKLDAVAETMANEYFLPLEDELTTMLCSHQGDSSEAAVIKEEVTAICQNTFDTALENFEMTCQTEFKNLQTYLIGDHSIQEKKPFRKDLRLHLGDLRSKVGTGSTNPAMLLEKIVRLAPPLLEAIENITAHFTAQAVEGGVKQVTAQAVNRGGQQLAERAGEALTRQGGGQVVRSGSKILGKVVGVTVILAVAGWEIYSGCRKAAEENRQMEQHLRQVNHVAKRAATDLRYQFVGTARHYVADRQEPVVLELGQLLRMRNQQDSALEWGVAKAAELSGRLETVINDLNARIRE